MPKKPIDDFRKEELRGLFVLGLLAVFASVRVQYSSFMVQFGQLSLDIIPLLNIIIILWSLYAFFMVLGLSEDVIGKTAASVFRQNSKTFLLYNFLLLAVLIGIFGVVGFPHIIYLLGFIVILISYFFIVKLFEKIRRKKPRKKKTTKKEVTEKRQSFSVIALLICATLIMYIQNELVALSIFIIGVVDVLVFVYFQEEINQKKAKQQLLSYSD